MCRGVHLIDNVVPAFQRGIAVEVGNLGIESRRRMRRIDSLGDDESDASFGAAAIICGDVLTRHAAG